MTALPEKPTLDEYGLDASAVYKAWRVWLHCTDDLEMDRDAALKRAILTYEKHRAPDSRLLAAHEALRKIVALGGYADPLLEDPDAYYRGLYTAYNDTARIASAALTAPGDDARREAEREVIEAAKEMVRYRKLIHVDPRNDDGCCQAIRDLDDAVARLTGKPEGDEKETSNG